MSQQESFADCAIVSCGTLIPELTQLREEGFLDAARVLFTRPGRHEVPRELEEQLVDRVQRARAAAANVVVVYGGTFCYVNVQDPMRTIDTLIAEQGPNIARIDATHCVDMLASDDQRREIAGGGKVYWMTPGWMEYSRFVYQDWDQGKANENFPRHTDGAILLDGVGYFDRLAAERPERILELSDWMGIPITPYPIDLDRLKNLLLDCLATVGDGASSPRT